MNIEISTEELVNNISAGDVLQYMDQHELSTLVRDYLSKNLLDKRQQQGVHGLLHLFIEHAAEVRATCSQSEIDELIQEYTK
jgi:hypothetical protein